MGQVGLSDTLHSSLTCVRVRAGLGLGVGVGVGVGSVVSGALLAHIDRSLQARCTVLGTYLEGAVRHRVPGSGLGSGLGPWLALG